MRNLKSRIFEWFMLFCVATVFIFIGVGIFQMQTIAQTPDAPAVATMKAAGYGDVVAYEALTIASVSKAMTSATYTTDVKKAFCTLETNSIYFTLDNNVTVPTSAGVGHKLETGQTLTLNGYSQITGFRAVRSSSTSATLKCTYLK